MEKGVTAWWGKEQGQSPEVISSPEGIDDLISRLANGPADHNMAQIHSLDRPPLPSGYPDHELMIGVDGQRGVGLLALMNPDVGNIYSQGEPGGRDTDDLAYFLAGHRMEYPGETEISLDLVRAAVKEFMISGGRMPECVRWQKPENW